MNKHETIALVSCVKGKATGPCPAKDLYQSALFRKMRAYAEREADRWFILSAEHGLVAPDTILSRYERTLAGAPQAARRGWAQRVLVQMAAADLLCPETKFLWLAGAAYKKHLAVLLSRYEQIDPLVGMGIGKRLAWLTCALRA